MSRGGTRNPIHLAAISAVARGPAFVVPVLIAAAFGAGRNTDAYFLAYAAVQFLIGTLAQGIEQSVVPFAAHAIRHDEGAARAYLDRAARGAVVFGSASWLIGVPIFVFATRGALRWQALQYSLLFTPLALSWCAAAIFAGALVSQWRIGISTGSLLWRGLGACIGIGLIPFGGSLWSVAIGLGIGEIYRVWWLRSHLYTGVGSKESRHAEPLRQLAAAAGAQILASAAIAVAPVVERLMASSLGIGSVSRLEYAMRLLMVPSVLFDGAIVPLLLARWTEQIAADRRPPARGEVLRTVGEGFVLAFAIGVVLAIFAPALVHLLLAHGRFAPEDEAVVATTLRYLSLAFVANMTAQMLERHYIATTRNQVLAALSLARAVIRIAIAWSLLSSLGLPAFAVGFAISDVAYVAALIGLLRAPSKAAQPAELR